MSENKEERKTRTKKHENLNIDEMFEEEYDEVDKDLYSNDDVKDFYEEENKKEKKVVMKKVKKKKSKKGLFIVLFLLLIVLGSIGFIIVMSPKIKLIGDKNIKLTIKSEYIESGAKAEVFGKDKTKNIKVKGKVNTKKKGKYTITYTIKNLFLEKKVKRVVEVVDEGPVITLEGDKFYSICPKKEYEEVGFKANTIKGDVVNEDDLTKSVESKLENDVVTYKVTDKKGTMFVITRNLIREDKEAPVIKLNGNDHIYVTLNNKFNEPGYVVEDNCNDDLTDGVKTEGEVDTSKLGDYEINYSVKDEAGNEAVAKRVVTIQKEIVKRTASLGCGEPGVIYLTFDDGPNNSTTTTILNVLKKYDVKATFFVTNTNGGSDSQIKREFDEGHLVALHTDSHEYSRLYASDEAYYNDLKKISDRVERITGQKSKIIRFPGGSSNTVSRHYSTGIMSRLANDVEAKGYTYVDWNVDSTDAETATKTSDLVYSRVTSQLSKSKGNVVLMHDIKSTTAGAIERIVQYGLNNGYTFKVLDSSVVCHHRTAN